MWPFRLNSLLQVGKNCLIETPTHLNYSPLHLWEGRRNKKIGSFLLWKECMHSLRVYGSCRLGLTHRIAYGRVPLWRQGASRKITLNLLLWLHLCNYFSSSHRVVFLKVQFSVNSTSHLPFLMNVHLPVLITISTYGKFDFK